MLGFSPEVLGIFRPTLGEHLEARFHGMKSWTLRVGVRESRISGYSRCAARRGL